MSADRAYYSFTKFIIEKLSLLDPEFKYYQERVPEGETSPYLHFSSGAELFTGPVQRFSGINVQAWVVCPIKDTEPPMLTLDNAINKLRAITLDNGQMPLYDNYTAGSPQVGHYLVKLSEISQKNVYKGKAQCVMTWYLTAVDARR